MSASLFDDDQPLTTPAPTDASTPLAERMRPRTLDDIVGQDAILAPGAPLREAIERDLLQSIILWGPPGTGKTTLARILASMTRAHFVPFSAVLSGIKEIKEVMAAAQMRRQRTGVRTIVFVDEIHRFNKAQQDAFLPRVEAGDIVLIGATTENPSFEVNAALLSRSKVVKRPSPAGEITSQSAGHAKRGQAYYRASTRVVNAEDWIANGKLGNKSRTVIPVTRPDLQ
jgi:putative ATPase